MLRITALAAILLAGFPQFTQGIYSPALPSITLSLQTTGQFTQWTLSLYFIGFALGVLLWGTLSDHFGRRFCMLWGITCYTLASIACIFMSTIYGLFVAMLIQAFGVSVGSVITMAMIRDSYQEIKLRNHLFALVGGSLAITHATGPLLGGYLVQYLGWHTNFAFLSLMGLMLLIYAYKTLPETHRYLGQRHQEHHLGRLLWKMLQDIRILGFAFLVSAFNGIFFSYYAEAPYIFTHIFHLSASIYGASSLVIALAWAVGAYISTQLNRHWQAEKLIVLSCLLTWGGSIILLITTYFGCLSTPSLILNLSVFLFSMFLIFLGFGIGIPNCLSIALIDYQHVLGSAGALFGMLYYLLIAGFTLLMGWIHNGKLITMPLYFTCIAILMLIIAIIIYHRQITRR